MRGSSRLRERSMMRFNPITIAAIGKKVA